MLSRKFVVPMFLLLVSCLAVGSLAQGCSSSNNRAQMLMMLAAGETRMITDPKDRLTRQLNLAYIQIHDGHKEDALITLRDARETVGSAGEEDFDQTAKLAAWISLSQLGRQAEGRGFADESLTRALEFLNKLEPVENRCKYVRSVATEVRDLRGAPKASELFVSGGAWAKAYEDQPVRRWFIVSFAVELFNDELFERGLEVMRNEDDAVWRADTLLQLAGKIPGGPVPIVEEASVSRREYDFGDGEDVQPQLQQPASLNRSKNLEVDVSFEKNYQMQ